MPQEQRALLSRFGVREGSVISAGFETTGFSKILVRKADPWDFFEAGERLFRIRVVQGLAGRRILRSWLPYQTCEVALEVDRD